LESQLAAEACHLENRQLLLGVDLETIAVEQLDRASAECAARQLNYMAYCSLAHYIEGR
jgi:hypothetical protein